MYHIFSGIICPSACVVLDETQIVFAYVDFIHLADTYKATLNERCTFSFKTPNFTAALHQHTVQLAVYSFLIMFYIKHIKYRLFQRYNKYFSIFSLWLQNKAGS